MYYFRIISLVELLVLTRSTLAVQSVYSKTDEGLYHYPDVSEYPFVVALTSKLGVCTGVIVAREWVLTAAHCLYNAEVGDVLAGDGVEVVAGSTDYLYEDAVKEKLQRTGSVEIKVHPLFWHGRLGKYDVALVKVRDPFTYSEFVNATTIEHVAWPQRDRQQQKCFTLGYGGLWSVEQQPTSKLKKRTIYAKHGQKACFCTLRFQNKRVVCIKERRYSLMCAGDDGGPLICQKKVVGVGHMVRGRETCSGDVGYPTSKCMKNPDPSTTFYYYLCPAGDWLHSVVPDIPNTPASCDASRATLAFLVLVLQIVVLLNFWTK